MKIEIHIYDKVKVKLTKDGIAKMKCNHDELLKDRHDDYPFKKFTPPDIDNEGYSEFMLFVLMEEFKGCLKSGSTPMFKDGIIVIDT